MTAKGDVVKIVYVDGTLSNGVTRAIRGVVIDDNEKEITIERDDGRLTIGKNFIIKIEQWRGHP